MNCSALISPLPLYTMMEDPVDMPIAYNSGTKMSVNKSRYGKAENYV